MHKPLFSILELALITEGGSASQSFHHALDLAQFAEQLGYQRFWFAEHHNMKGVASSAPQILIGYVAGGTKKISVGSGGIMLPNHAPLVIAEQFGTLDTLYPGRIDLGLGRAPGTDPLTANALRRNRFAAEHFPEMVLELMAYVDGANDRSPIKANPGEGLRTPVWILGSSTESAALAAHLGLPYAFATHFAPTQFEAALHIYRKNFKPSESLSKPYVMPCINIVAAEEQAEAEWLASSMYQMFMGVINGESRLLAPPVKNMNQVWDEYHQAVIKEMLRYSFIGDEEKVAKSLEAFIRQFEPDEIMISGNIYDHAARRKSFEIVSRIFAGMEERKTVRL